jgi:CBS domain-containing protein
LLAAAALGLVAGGFGTLLTLLVYGVEDAFARLPIHWMWWPALGAVVVGLGGLVEPRVLGAGYNSIQALLDGSLMLKAIILLLVAKAIVWLVALGSGTSGGILAPLLILGGSLGAIAGHWLPGGSGAWALLGMAGVMGAAMRAPLTAAVFAVELTGRFDALPTTLAAAGAAYAVAVLLLKRSILTEKISRRGRHVLQEYSIDPLALTQAGQIMTEAPETLAETMAVRDAIAFFEQRARHRSYPVVDAQGRPRGIASRADALRWRQAELPVEVTLGDQLSDISMPAVYPTTPASDVANLMITEDIGRVCVIAADSGKLIGIIARRDLLQPRADSLRDERDRVGGASGKRSKEAGRGLRRKSIPTPK